MANDDVQVYLQEKYEKNKETKFIPLKNLQFEVHLTDHCNLCCCGCDNLAPLAVPFYVDPGRLEKDLNRLSYLFDRTARYIRLVGGEPLLHPHISEIIKMCRDFFPTTRLEIVTNGLLLMQMPDGFYRACNDCEVIISASKYPVGFDYESARSFIEKRGIKWIYNNDGNKVMYKFPFSLLPDNDAKDNYIICNRSNNCITLRNGRLSTCSLFFCINSFNSYFNTNIETFKEDTVDIYAENDSDTIMEKLARPIGLCKYCRLRDSKYHIEWRKSERRIEEWI